MTNCAKKHTALVAGACFAGVGVLFRLMARSLASTEMGSGMWSIDETAQTQLQHDARIILLFGLAWILLAWRRWLGLPGSPVDPPGIQQ